ncbi:MAG: hypothetical protein CSA75_00860 [Sorangium cellulosum]|nr:MAG: hypothetical protein CSA75_00860 [Sorangium cellulosum]
MKETENGILTPATLQGPLLAVICDRCGRENPDHLIFCQDCGKRLQSAASRIVPPTPPKGIRAIIPDSIIAAPPVGQPPAAAQPAPAQPDAQVVSGHAGPPAPSASIPQAQSAEIVCRRCQTRNPLEGKFCVSCGAAIPSVLATPEASTNAEQTTHPSPVPTAGVVQVTPDKPVEAKLPARTCDRCQGVCDGGMRFCKFCGAPLPMKSDPHVPAVRAASALAPHVATPMQASPEHSAAQVKPPQIEPAVTTSTPRSAERYTELKDQHDKRLPTQKDSSDTASDAPATSSDSKPDNSPAQGNSERVTDGKGSAGNPDGPYGEPMGAAETPGGKTGQFVPFSGSSSPPAGRLVVVSGDGQQGPSFPLVGDQVDIGRSEGTVVLSDDKYMSPRHARLVRLDGSWHLRDLESTNGVFFRLREPHELVEGDVLLLGVEVLRFEFVTDAELALGPAVQHGTMVFGSPALPRPARLVQRTVEGVARDVYHLHRLETIIGRESGDIVFTDDPYMSRRHATIRRSTSAGSMTLVDLDSSNGTFVAIRGDCVLKDGDSIRVGQHLFRVELAPRANV